MRPARWAETARELLGPWLGYAQAGGAVPFSQVHGHASVVSDWDSAEYWPGVPQAVIDATAVDRSSRRYRAQVGERSFTGVDWIMLAGPPARLSPLLQLKASHFSL
jgi:hypothetical protein